MLILHITRESGSDARYGIGKSLAPVSEALRERGHVVEVFDGDAARKAPTSRLTRWLGRRILALIQRRYVLSSPEPTVAQTIVNMLIERATVAWAGAQYASKIGATHVHCHDPVLAYLYKYFSFLHGATRRWGVTEHGYGAYVQDRQGVAVPSALLTVFQKWEREVARSAAWLCAPSHLGLQQLALDLQVPDNSSANWPPENWHVVGHSKPVLQSHERSKARLKLHLREEDQVILAVGQLIPMKRFQLLIEACSLLEPALRPYIIILGEGDQGPIWNTASNVGVDDRLRIEFTDDIGLYLTAADVYVSTSATESFGMANCEALAAGLPAVCTAVGAVPEIIGDAALLVTDSAADIAVALGSLLSNSSLRVEFSAKALRWAARWPSPSAIADEMERIYSSRV